MNDPLICFHSTYHAKFSLSLVSPPQAGWTLLSFGLNQTDPDLSFTCYTFLFVFPDVVILLTAASVSGQ